MRNNEKRRIDREVERTLDSLDHINDIEVGPFFYARLKARIQAPSETSPPWLFRFLLGRRAPALLASVLVLNILTAVVILRDDNGTQAEVREDYVSVVASEYFMTGSTSWLDIGAE